MSDLSDEDIARCETLADFVNEDFWSLLAEVKRHRAAVAADEERVRSVVGSIAARELQENRMLYFPASSETLAETIAIRAAKQLAGAAVKLSDTDRVALQRVRDGLSRICLSTPESRDDIAAIDRLLSTVRP